jgi:hypothetical protein
MDRQHIEREKALFLYTSALESGDFETVERVLLDAEKDATLEKMILEVHEEYSAAEVNVEQTDAANVVRQLLHQYLPSGFSYPTESDPAPLTVSDVVARMQSDATTPDSTREAKHVAAQLLQKRQQDTLLPEKLNLPGVRQLFHQIGVSVSHQFEKWFKETAIFLSMGREQNMARMAAARRQQRQVAERGTDSEHQEEGQ